MRLFLKDIGDVRVHAQAELTPGIRISGWRLSKVTHISLVLVTAFPVDGALPMKGVGEVIERSDSVILGARGSTFWRLAVPVVPPTSHTTASDNNNQRQRERLY